MNQPTPQDLLDLVTTYQAERDRMIAAMTPEAARDFGNAHRVVYRGTDDRTLDDAVFLCGRRAMARYELPRAPVASCVNDFAPLASAPLAQAA